MSNLIHNNKDRNKHLKNQVGDVPTIKKSKKVAAEESTNIRVSKNLKDELNAIVHVKKYQSVNALLEVLKDKYLDELDDADRELIERIK